MKKQCRFLGCKNVTTIIHQGWYYCEKHWLQLQEIKKIIPDNKEVEK